ncbi:hypothetical protein QQ020_35835 [Fulvivirgaceae bacterium BMA12]|uniref:Lipoprotein n=1 Tax=Agaribacillus aureus TaxID=3051825 RepID=A0ABT8LI70_9BACT|nr:hypothetical protein [Fulvivirgaceae bacterium BMA12]
MRPKVLLILIPVVVISCKSYVDKTSTSTKNFSITPTETRNIFEFHSSTVESRDNEVIHPAKFSLSLPIGIRSYGFTNLSSFGFYYDQKQVIFISTNDALSEVLEGEIEINRIVDLVEKLPSGSGKFNISEIQPIGGRKHYLLKNFGGHILLFNVKPNNLESWKNLVSDIEYQ